MMEAITHRGSMIPCWMKTIAAGAVMNCPMITTNIIAAVVAENYLMNQTTLNSMKTNWNQIKHHAPFILIAALLIGTFVVVPILRIIFNF